MADEAQPNNAATMPPTGTPPPPPPPPPPVDVTPATPTHGGRYIQYKVSDNNTFEVTAKYKPPIEQAGSGAYGFVCSFLNSETNKKVAIKKIAHAFDVRSDAKKTLREIKLLSHMEHENVDHRDTRYNPASTEGEFSDVYIVYELMETDLHRVIHSNQTLTPEHIQYFMYQILRGLKYIHSANVLHRDLKPSNILVNINCDVKICDFGLARVSSDTEFMSGYVVTRWYRPPELLLKSLGSYNSAIDVWSVGCIFMELMDGKPLFPGRDSSHQMHMIFQLLGTPSEDEMSHMSENAKKYIGQLPIYEKQSFIEKFPLLNPLAIDLVEKMLAFDPKKRITVVDALAHPFFGLLRDESDEPVCLNPFTDDVDRLGLNEEQMKDVIYQESLRYNPNHKLSCE